MTSGHPPVKTNVPENIPFVFLSMTPDKGLNTPLLRLFILFFKFSFHMSVLINPWPKPVLFWNYCCKRLPQYCLLNDPWPTTEDHFLLDKNKFKPVAFILPCQRIPDQEKPSVIGFWDRVLKRRLTGWLMSFLYRTLSQPAWRTSLQ